MNSRQIPAPRNFYLMVIGQIISILGSSLLRFALSLYVLDITGRADVFAALFAVSNIPMLLSPIGGAVADRFSRKKLMVLFDFMSSSIVFLLFLLIVLKAANVMVIGVIMVLVSAISAMYTPSVTASIPLLVENQKIEGANGIVQAVQALSGVAAPILGGILYGMIGIHVLVLLSGFAFFLSAVMELFINIPFEKRTMEHSMAVTICEDLKEGSLYVIKQSFIVKAMILATLMNLLLTPFLLIGGPFILRISMGTTNTMYGIAMGLINAASILGALSVGYFGKRIQVGTLYRALRLIAVLLIPIVVAVLPYLLANNTLLSFLLFLAGAIPAAMIMTMLSIYVIAKVQKKTPNENLGKVMAIITAVSQCAAPIGQLLYGALFKIFSTRVFIPSMMAVLSMLCLSIFCKKIMRHEKGIS